MLTDCIPRNLILKRSFYMKAVNKLSILLVGSVMLLAALTPAIGIPTVSMAPRIHLDGLNNSQAYSTGQATQ